MMAPQATIRRALGDPALLGKAIAGASWAAWRALLLAIMGEPLETAEAEIFRRLTGRASSPQRRVRQFWGVVGRRGGKSRAMAVLAVYLATLCRYPMLSAGERGTILIVAPDQRQASIILGYAAAILRESPKLGKLLKRDTTEAIELKNGIFIEVRAASFRRLRGMTALAVIGDEVAFWLADEASANPDVEIINAMKPALLTTGGPLIGISSPYARRGVLWDAYSAHFGAGGDPEILVAQGASRDLNPSLPQSEIDAEYAKDPIYAAAEYDAQFRSDLEAFVSREVVDACTDFGDFERPHYPHFSYAGFIDPSGGSVDSMTMAIAHAEENMAVLDGVWEVTPPFSPAEVVEEFADRLKAYGITRCFGDRYAVLWVVEQFSLCGIQYEHAEETKSELYGSLLPMLNSRSAALVDNERLRRQLLGLERRTGRGRDVIDHGRGGHDDLANAAAGALVLARHSPMATSVPNFGRTLEYARMGVA